VHILQVKQGFSETRGVELVYTLQCEAREKGIAAGQKLRCNSDANNDKEE